MKEFLKEFKEFALKGNVMDLAVGVIIGAAFGDIVKAFTEDIINPLINCIGGAKIAGRIPIFATGQYINYGHLLTAIINFLIMAFAIFMIMKGMNKLIELGRRKKEVEEEETEKECPYCMSKISIKATRCPNCTSKLEEVEEDK